MRTRPRSISATVAVFAGLGVATVAVVAVLAGLATHRVADDEALHAARELTRTAAVGSVEPNLGDGVVRERPRALARLDRAVHVGVLRAPIVRVKLWTLDGRIVYSDAHALIGRRFALGADERRAARLGEVRSDVSDASKPENVLERGLGPLLEVYLPVRTPSGRPLLYEEYLRAGVIAASGRRMWLALVPGVGGALALVALAQLPLAWWLVRRLRQREREREGLLLRTMAASDRERGELAHALHEGPVQGLAGLAWRLEAAARHAGPPLDGDLREDAGQAREALRGLRALLVGLHPARLHDSGLAAALADTAAPLRAAGVDVRLDLDAAEVDPDVERLVYRVADEALRNARRHAGAHRVDVRTRVDGGRVRLSVRDDGRGFSGADRRRSEADGHRGLALLDELAAEAGAVLAVRTAPGAGTAVELDAPATP